MSNTNANLPNPTSPVLMPNGQMSPAWFAFFLALFNRTGGPGSPIDINTLQQQDEISQDVPPQNAATILALRGVEELWSEQRAPENLSHIRARLADLEAEIATRPDLAALSRRIDDVESLLADLKPPAPAVIEQWTAPTLLNSWVNFGGAFNPAGYWKDPFGVVHLRGLVKSGTPPSVIFTLPVGYRPPSTNALATVSADAFSEIRIDNAGNVNAFNGSSTWVSLDGLTFRAA